MERGFATKKLAVVRIAGLTALVIAGALTQQARMRPQTMGVAEYERTLDALERYRSLASEDDGGVLPETEGPVRPGDSWEGVPRLIRLLKLTGDLRADVESGGSAVYDGQLVIAVQRFQNRHGLAPSGKIDRATLAQLNVPLSVRVHQLELAAEQWRRNPYDPSRPAILINLPEFRLRAIRDNHIDLNMKIVVGQAPERKTPLLSSELEEIIFRPYWNVPLKIQREELVPEIERNHSYLSEHDYELVNADGAVVRGKISGARLAQLRSGQLHLRQVPGPKNALGLVKFVFPNSHDVYLHDTSFPSAFYRSRRDLSHGCIRVEKAEALAEWVLGDESGWTRERVVEAMRGPESMVVKLREPIQVVIVYVTAMVMENGEVHFFNDIYGEDEALDQAPAGAAARVSPR
jgi:murein L,D-transpeptidase YcbB/YkuD